MSRETKKLKRTKVEKRENYKERERQRKIKRSWTWEGEKWERTSSIMPERHDTKGKTNGEKRHRKKRIRTNWKGGEILRWCYKEKEKIS